jgi:Protein of unknown function (DUF1488)
MFGVLEMGHRGRVTVELGKPSEHVLQIMPAGVKRLGLVSLGSGDPGVLGQQQDGSYVMLDVRGTTPLDLHKFEAALEAAAPRGAGRPRHSYELRKVFSVSLEPSLAEWARELGGGNLSEGVAMALRERRDATSRPRIQFVPNAWRRSNTGDLVFEATVDGEPRECFITYEALRDHFGASNRTEGELKRAFVSGIDVIRALAIRKLTHEAGDPILRTEDFEGII